MDLLSCLDPPAPVLVARPAGRASSPERQEVAANLRRAKKAGADALFFAVFYGGYVFDAVEVGKVADLMLDLLERACPSTSSVVPG